MFITVLAAIGTVVYNYLFVLSDDTSAPEITIDSEVIEVSVKATEEELLSGVSAKDKKDGDVTENVLIEGILPITEENTATITYAAFDSSGNVSKASRTVKYVDYEAPVFGQTGSLSFAENTSPDVLGFMSAHDVIDGDISGRIKGMIISETTSLNFKGIHQVEFRVTNSMGDTEHIVLPVEIYENGAYNAALELSDYLVYLKVGDEFDPKIYPEKLRVGNFVYYVMDENESGTRKPAKEMDIDVENGVMTEIPGIYSVIYTVTYADRYIGYARLNVVVEE